MQALDDDEAKRWLVQARKKSSRPAWQGMDKCTRPAKGRAACLESGNPHRHCECGVPIDLNHGYCDDCFKRLIAGEPMTEKQSLAKHAQRQAWLVRYGFIVFAAILEFEKKEEAIDLEEAA